jgi:hypothetical protein
MWDRAKQSLIFVSLIGVTLVIVGAVFWAESEFNKSVGCESNKTIDELSHLFTDVEVAARFQSCLANAQAELRWSLPIAIIGIVILASTGIISAGLIYTHKMKI